jgi:hypothetical protein
VTALAPDRAKRASQRSAARGGAPRCRQICPPGRAFVSTSSVRASASAACAAADHDDLRVERRRV